jgi:AAA15 family ATPase/GTPase
MGAPMLYGDVGLKELVPIAYVGDGLRNLLSMLLAVMCAEGGIVLIDEIENGLHHSVLEGVWSALADAARKADVQIFATTHSMECIHASHAAFAKSATYDLRVHRLEVVDGQIRAVTSDQESLAGAIQFNWEIR